MPKILLCTVEAWSKNNATSTAFTLSELIKDYPANDLAALYIRDEVADSPVCSQYFKISEQKVIKSVFHPSIKTGEKIILGQLTTETDNNDLIISQTRYKKYGRKRNFFLLLAREILWRLGYWKSKELKSFLDDFNPDIVIFGIESYVHFNRINRFIIRYTGAKAIGFIWDDHISYKTSGGFSKKILRFFKRKSVKKTARCCHEILAIAPKTKAEVDKYLKVNSTIMTKPISTSVPAFFSKEIKKPIHMLYTGNLRIGRDKTLRLLSTVLKELNVSENALIVDVYTTTELDAEMQKGLMSSIHIYPPITQEEVMIRQKETDVLLFLEDLSKEHRYDSRLSFSTKLTDYFSSGKCILAIAPPNIASMEYLKTEDAALCASSVAELKALIVKLITCSEIINVYAKKAFDCGKNNHSRELLVGRLQGIIEKLAGK